MSSKNNYSVDVKNRFAQLDSDAESDSETRPAVKPTQNTTSGSPQKQAADTRVRGAREPRRQQAVKNGARSELEATGRGPQPRREGKAFMASGDAEVQQRAARRRPKPTGEGQAVKPGRPGQSSRGGRLHDRQSGTGRGREMKKSGAGGHNWGNDVIVPDTNGRASGEISGTELPENDAKAVDAGDQSPAAESATSTVPTGQSAPTSQEDEIIGFAAYQKEQRMRRALLQQTQIVVSSARNIDASELEKEGYQRYEREETEEERAARERRMQKLHRNNDRDGSNDSDVERNLQRKDIKTPVFQFKRPVSFGQRRGARGGAHGQRSNRGEQRRPAPVEVDLADTTAFPNLC